MGHLHAELQRLAEEFMQSVLSALMSAPLDEVLDSVEPTAGRKTKAMTAPGDASADSNRTGTGPRLRRSSGEIEKQKDAVLRAAGILTPGFRKSDVTKHAALDVNVSRALGLLVAEGKLRREGERGSARYWTA